MPITVLFENADFLVADKPAGVLSAPARSGAADPRPCLVPLLNAQRAGEARAAGEEQGLRLWLVHRLDADVSGVILLAKNAQAHRAANGWFESRQVGKTYEAWTEAPQTGGLPEAGRVFEWTTRMARGKKRAYESSHGKEAITRATFVGWRERCEWRLEPRTGRSHQLRFELARHGFPILGDTLYGARAPFRAGAIALRAVTIDFSGCADARAFGLPAEAKALGLSRELI